MIPAGKEANERAAKGKTPALHPGASQQNRRQANPRIKRALLALLQGTVPRKQLDRISGASNSPDIVKNIRASLGFDAVECKLVPGIDSDGRACRPGLYSLTATGRAKAEAWLRLGADLPPTDRLREA